MITDDERRDVAEILRKTRVKRYNSILNGIHLGESVGVGAQIVSPHEDQVRAAADRLADLIEPSVRCPHYMFPCCRTDAGGDPIDRDGLLELADICERTGDMYAATHSESAGGELRDLLRSMAELERKTARIIRNALGVPDECQDAASQPGRP